MKVIKEKEKTTYVVFLLDESVSMKSVRKETLSGFNEQLTVVKEMLGPDHAVFVSFMTFSEPTKIRVLRKWVRASEIKPLTEDEYLTDGGSTALLDGMLEAIELIKTKDDEIKERKNAALVMFFTDGQENNSKKAKASQIKEAITALRDTDRYTFTFMGCLEGNIVEKEYGISAGSTTTFAFGASGAFHNSAVTAGALRNYSKARNAGSTQVANFYDDNKKVTTGGNPDDIVK